MRTQNKTTVLETSTHRFQNRAARESFVARNRSKQSPQRRLTKSHRKISAKSPNMTHASTISLRGGKPREKPIGATMQQSTNKSDMRAPRFRERHNLNKVKFDQVRQANLG
jgi:hypothetical protein